MKRRTFIHASALSLTGLCAGGRLFAAPSDTPRFLLVFLRGGYDCANMLIPYTSDFYYESRPKIAIPKPDPATTTGALTLDAHWALAPALRESLAPLYQRNQIAFIPFAGTEDLSRSHFETQDSIERGEPLSGPHDYRSGFLARLASVVNGAAPIAFTDAMPLSFKGDADVPNISLKGLSKPAFDQRQASILADMYSAHHLSAAVNDGLELRQEVAQAMQDEMREANRGAVTTKGFELEAGRIGKLMREQYRLGFVDIGGWDTHVNEGAAQGALANNLENLGRGLHTFADTMGSEWNKTVVVVVSEFGRTFRENGNAGTDHGHGSVYWILGGNVKGGIVGEQIDVRRENLFQDRDYPVLNDYRAMLASLYRGMFSLSDSQLDTVFPSVTPADLKLV